MQDIIFLPSSNFLLFLDNFFLSPFFFFFFFPPSIVRSENTTGLVYEISLFLGEIKSVETRREQRGGEDNARGNADERQNSVVTSRFILAHTVDL